MLEMEELQPCRHIRVIAFRGDRSRVVSAKFRVASRGGESAVGSEPTRLDSLLFTGHTGVSVDGGQTILAFNPSISDDDSIRQMFNNLKAGGRYPGVVLDDTAVFSVARERGRTILWFDVVLPSQAYEGFVSRLDRERENSQYSYGFPNGDGDCNCVTWLARLGLPLLSGRMIEFIGAAESDDGNSRRFGKCVEGGLP